MGETNQEEDFLKIHKTKTEKKEEGFKKINNKS